MDIIKQKAIHTSQFSFDKFDYNKWFGKYHNRGLCFKVMPVTDHTYVLVYADAPKIKLFYVDQRGQLICNTTITGQIKDMFVVEGQKLLIAKLIRGTKNQNLIGATTPNNIIFQIWDMPKNTLYKLNKETIQLRDQQKLKIYYFYKTNIICIRQFSNNSYFISYYRIVSSSQQYKKQQNQQKSINKQQQIRQYESMDKKAQNSKLINKFYLPKDNSSGSYYVNEMQVNNTSNVAINFSNYGSNRFGYKFNITVIGLENVLLKNSGIVKYELMLQLDTQIQQFWQISQQQFYLQSRNYQNYQSKHIIFDISTQNLKTFPLKVSQKTYNIQFLNNFRPIQSYQLAKKYGSNNQQILNIDKIQFQFMIPVYVVHFVKEQKAWEIVGRILINKSTNVQDWSHGLIQFRRISQQNGNFKSIQGIKAVEMPDLLERRHLTAYLLSQFDEDLIQKVISMVSEDKA